MRKHESGGGRTEIVRPPLWLFLSSCLSLPFVNIYGIHGIRGFSSDVTVIKALKEVEKGIVELKLFSGSFVRVIKYSVLIKLNCKREERE
ncbi:hypothetical protein C6Y45_01005 [Alkalicoccus saliphilus]|uniref:Uncharacterized protein n=1 Tax=Alkalicoccus saliphilus TaxID=200989 RepID=A0A2T4UAT6_9BACI|nr:hypothetical protein C6Y45_01005 [Alkalicoccus saliphilus]